MVNKRGQIWGADLMIAASIFVFGITIFYFYSINVSNESPEIMENLFYEGNFIANTILSEGAPIEWNETNVLKIGILTGDKINSTKLEMFYNLTKTDYEQTKINFNTKYDYVFLLNENMSIDSNDVDYIGKPGINLNDLPAENLIKITRFVSYENVPKTAYMYVWRNY